MKINMMIKILKRTMIRFVRDTSAAIVLMFALMAPLIISASGMALDFAQAYLVQQRLSQAIDAAALAAAAISSDSGVIEQKVKDFFDVNYPEEKLGATFEPVVIVDGDVVTVTGSARYTTYFLTLVGVDEIDVGAETVVQREVQGIEVVMVLDNTGSMGFNDNIGTLRTATCEFTEIIFGTFDADRTDDCLDRAGSFNEPNNPFVSVGLVPYSTSVNVGPYGLGFDDDGDVYDTSFMLNPAGLTFSNDGNTDLCVLEQDDGTDVTDNEGPWFMYRWCRDRDDDSARCDLLQRDRTCTRYNSSGTCTRVAFAPGAPREVGRIPNYICPEASVLPLTNDMDAIKSRIGEMRARGNTYGSTGMVWGYRMISPRFPFTEATEFDNQGYRKVVVMMTDGNNIRRDRYSAYGLNEDNNVNSNGAIDNRFRDTCENMDELDEITIYTITFEDQDGSIDDDTRQLYEDCAANGGRHLHVRSGEELRDVFREIATELSNLRIRS